MSAPLKVLVVDDSAVVRQAFAELLTEKGGMEVSVAPDGVVAMSKLERFAPDVVVLDLDLPRMDGFAFLRWVMANHRTPVVVCSSASAKGTEVALRSLEEGAVDVVAKPRRALETGAPELIEAIRGAAGAHPRSRGASSCAPATRAPSSPGPRLLVMGASTGGTEALREVLARLPETFPGVVLVQHLPKAFTGRFAQRLDEACALEVREAKDGDEVQPGLALVAPGGQHAVVKKDGARLWVSLHSGPPLNKHRPSVDALFVSAAEAAGERTMGVLLTGMGADGAEGLLALRRAGAFTVAQDEASCVVFGMPREAIHRGAAACVLPLEHIGAALIERVASPPPNAGRSP